MTTRAYRRNGAVLAMPRLDAGILAVRGIGIREPSFDAGSLVGIRVSGGDIDTHIPGETPRMVLVGGIEVSRGDRGDVVSAIRVIYIDGLFDGE